MASKGILYGVVTLFLALLMITSSLALYYYGQNQQNTSQNQTYVGELRTALANYRSLSGSFNASLADYGRTLNLLGSAVANLNTSSQVYRNASLALASLWSSYQQLSSSGGRRALVYGAHMLLEFGNGTRRWYNNTSVEPGWNGYVVTLVLLKGNVKAVWYPQYGEHLVTGLDGASQGSSTSWFLWQFGPGGWNPSAAGADQLRVDNGTTFAWTLCGYDANYNPTCRP